MSIAYNPGLQVTEFTMVRKERRLPLKGEVLVHNGDRVTSDQVVAQTFLPGNVHVIAGANRLNCMPNEVKDCLVKAIGALCTKDELIACNRGLFGLLKYKLYAPLAGTLESASDVTGQIILREPPIPVQIKSFVDGEVVAVIPDEGAIIATAAGLVQGIFGIGGEVVAPLQMGVASPEDDLTEEQILPAYRGKIVVGGKVVTGKAMNRAIVEGVAGIVTGSIHDFDLTQFLGYDLGVAITGAETKGLTIVITEGFGAIPMSQKTFQLLKKYEGAKVSMHGVTQIRAGVIRPEIIIPMAANADHALSQTIPGLDLGTWVRIVREPHFGRVAKVVALPVELCQLATETMARVVEVMFTDGCKQLLPRANVEILEK